MTRERRLRMVPVRVDDLVDLLRPRNHGRRVTIRAMDPPCPELDEADLHSVQYDYQSDSFQLLFAHPRWDEVPVGGTIPTMHLTLGYRVGDVEWVVRGWDCAQPGGESVVAVLRELRPGGYYVLSGRVLADVDQERLQHAFAAAWGHHPNAPHLLFVRGGLRVEPVDPPAPAEEEEHHAGA